ncbi:hypothetical protein E2562_030000 [Oryza meyeriana var. granulata]|uniref:Uncharacterized protein n=1 Tax=Oryza meyeriana var. granulata TaxID=110450 RepID=A0A6G1FDS2_9ORYZ|nr:hypothetical protein E2562_030000 [Oryza meyeriana var. granulata]
MSSVAPNPGVFSPRQPDLRPLTPMTPANGPQGGRAVCGSIVQASGDGLRFDTFFKVHVK